MSRFVIASSDGKEFVYGWDVQDQEYFLSRETNAGWRSYVGALSSMAGTGANLWKAMARHKIIPPMLHARQMRYDLPLTVIEEAPVKVESRWYGGIVISADGIQAIDFIEGNTIVVKGPLEE